MKKKLLIVIFYFYFVRNNSYMIIFDKNDAFIEQNHRKKYTAGI